jgi:hypothetical protein
MPRDTCRDGKHVKIEFGEGMRSTRTAQPSINSTHLIAIQLIRVRIVRPFIVETRGARGR